MSSDESSTRLPREDELMGEQQLREHLQSKAQESVGADNLREANRRWSVLQEWRKEQ